ncbi:MAG: 50S ribosomal protein L18 [Oligoflexales bacterium]|nr:50S ribosomal protein L18 [Oligoflexales bacterium]
MSTLSQRASLKLRRKKRVRKKIEGTAERPRLSVFKSAKHIYAQVIDDEKGVTLAQVSSFEKGQKMKANVEACSELGRLVAERCKLKNIEKIVFDKNGNMYHGRIKAFADGARVAGLIF